MSSAPKPFLHRQRQKNAPASPTDETDRRDFDRDSLLTPGVTTAAAKDNSFVLAANTADEVQQRMQFRGMQWQHGVGRRTDATSCTGRSHRILIAGKLSVIAGFKVRCGAALLLTLLVLATYFFHDFWKLEGQEQQTQMIPFMKNLSLIGTMVFLMANGAGAMILDVKPGARKADQPA